MQKDTGCYERVHWTKKVSIKVWSHLLKQSFMKNFIFWAMINREGKAKIIKPFLENNCQENRFI